MRLNANLSLPDGWGLAPLKRLTRFGYGEALAADDRDSSGPVMVYGSNGPFDQHSTANTLGPCIVVGRKGSYGKCQYSKTPVFAVDTTFVVDRRHTEADLRYLFYLLGSLGLDELSDDTAVPGLSREKAYQSLAPMPPLETQQRIAAFLDEKTAQIDGLIEKKRALLDRLAEKRQAIITQAVTKGLNPAAPMKDSGIDWLGQIPAHWAVSALGYRYEVQLGRMLNAERADGENMRPYLRVYDVQWGAINIDELPLMDFPPEAQARYRLRLGDLLVNEGGSYVGRSAIWDGRLEECYYQKALHRLRPYNDQVDTAEFLLLVMEGAVNQGVFVAGGNQTTIDHLTAEQFRRYQFAFPPFDEQTEIVNECHNRLNGIGSAHNKLTQSLDFLAEYRSALITAAVTGQVEGLR